MKKMRKLMAVAMSAAMVLALGACGGETASNDATQTGSASADGKVYNIGICQQLEHPALDAATEGFQAALKDKLGDNVKFDVQNEQANASTIANNFVSSDVDLILANATTALQACAAATTDIPILGTSVTDYATALEMSDWTGATGRNISGTSDLAPLDEQENMLAEFRMQSMSQYFTALQRQTPNIRQPSLKNTWMRTVSATKSLRHPIPMISVRLCRVRSNMQMSSIFQPTIQWHRIQKPLTISRFRPGFRLLQERKESATDVVSLHFPSVTMISDTEPERWLMISL